MTDEERAAMLAENAAMRVALERIIAIWDDGPRDRWRYAHAYAMQQAAREALGLPAWGEEEKKS